MSDYCMVYSTVDSAAQAERLAGLIIEQKLAACVNVLPHMQSFYCWDGAVQQSDERVLLCKTVAANESALCALLKKEHPYDVPCILTLPLSNGHPEFLQWVTEQTTR